MKKQNKNKVKSAENIDKAVNSIFFKMATNKAKKSITNPARMVELIQSGISKINSLENKGDVIGQMKKNFRLLVRMLKAFYNKQYTQISAATLLKVGAAIIYFLFVIDLIPDFVPVLGFLDDASILAWVIAAVKDDLDKFSEWEENTTSAEDAKES